MERRLPTLTIACILLPLSAWAQGEPPPDPPPVPPATAAPDAPDAKPAPAPAPKPAPPPAPPPGGQYYSEPPAAGGGQQPAGPPPNAGPPGQGVYEPPPPGYYQPVWEPPPPPKPRHRAPKTAFWLGPRVGYFIPFGNLWLSRDPASGAYDEVKWSDYASAGPMFELDVGARFSRHYNVFLLWERAELGNGSKEGSPFTPTAKQDGAQTDYYAIGLRFSSDADKVGFLTEIDLGYRRFRATWDDGSELRLTEAPLEFRIGLGADIRVTKFFSLSPLVTLGAGAFGSAEVVDLNGDAADATKAGDESAGHGWITFQLGAHFDIPGGDGD